MARLKVEGIASLERMLKDLSTLDGGKAEEDMLNAGRKEVEKAWEHQIQKHGLIDTGKMKKGIYSSKPKRNIWGIFSQIYPAGYDYYEEGPNKGKKRVRNAAKAFMQHYGFYNHATQSFYDKHVGWVDDVEKEALENATEVMTKVYDLYLKRKLKG